jgi:hypothetical protein
VCEENPAETKILESGIKPADLTCVSAITAEGCSAENAEPLPATQQQCIGQVASAWATSAPLPRSSLAISMPGIES